MRTVLSLLSALLLLALHHTPVAATGFSTFVVGPPVHEAITAVAAKMAGFTRTEVEHAINGSMFGERRERERGVLRMYEGWRCRARRAATPRGVDRQRGGKSSRFPLC